MIQDIAPYKYQNQFSLKTEPTDNSYLIVVKAGSILVKEEDEQVFLPQKKETHLDKQDLTYLFTIDEHTFFLAEAEKVGELPGFSYEKTVVFRKMNPKWMCFGGITGFQLANWYRANRFCGCCGNTMIHKKDERAVICPECGHIVYPKISPAVIVAVTKGDKIVLTKYAGRGSNPRYALIAGFAEIGESIEETVHREVMEEVGLKVKNLRFYKSQPWSFSDTLLMGFYCEVDGEEEITMDANELSVAEWVKREDMTIVNDGVSLTYEMMDNFMKGRI